jgi:hypothetical protein
MTVFTLGVSKLSQNVLADKMEHQVLTVLILGVSKLSQNVLA